jgi:hypothetical protein
MNELQHTQLILCILRTFNAIVRLGANNEKQTRVAAIDDLVAAVFQERALQLGPTEALADDFGFQCDSFFHADPFVVRGIPSLALFVAVYSIVCVVDCML